MTVSIFKRLRVNIVSLDSSLILIGVVSSATSLDVKDIVIL
jgi:hypothetical protein